jgi:uncharacterized membrane protein YfbV (UPF0208 family)
LLSEEFTKMFSFSALREGKEYADIFPLQKSLTRAFSLLFRKMDINRIFLDKIVNKMNNISIKGDLS